MLRKLSVFSCVAALALAVVAVPSQALAITTAPTVFLTLTNVDDGLDDLISFEITGEFDGNPGDELWGMELSFAASDVPTSLFVNVDGFQQATEPSVGPGGVVFDFPQVDTLNDLITLQYSVPPFAPGTFPSPVLSFDVDASGLDAGGYAIVVEPNPNNPLGPAIGFDGQGFPLDIAIEFRENSSKFTVDRQPEPTVVPEPVTATLGLLATAGLGLAATRPRHPQPESLPAAAAPCGGVFSPRVYNARLDFSPLTLERFP